MFDTSVKPSRTSPETSTVATPAIRVGIPLQAPREHRAAAVRIVEFLRMHRPAVNAVRTHAGRDGSELYLSKDRC